MEAAASSQQQQLDRIQLQMQQLLAQTSSITAAGSSSDSVSQVEAQRLANQKQLELLADVQARLMEEQVKLERTVKEEGVEENPKEDEEQEKPKQKAQPKAKSTALDKELKKQMQQQLKEERARWKVEEKKKRQEAAAARKEAVEAKRQQEEKERLEKRERDIAKAKSLLSQARLEGSINAEEPLGTMSAAGLGAQVPPESSPAESQQDLETGS